LAGYYLTGSPVWAMIFRYKRSSKRQNKPV
jgi:hypothetical protein